MKKLLLSLTIISVIAVLIAATNKTNSAPPENFKNLKVLPKDINKDALDSVMDYFKMSLGVKCNFCHARKKDTTQKGLDFESDAKDEKTTARDMWKMTAYLNATYFNDEHSTRTDTIHTIVCYTCHRGNKQPDVKDFMLQMNSDVQGEKNRKGK